jgi:hypothetical protein
MGDVEEIEAAIDRLPPDEFRRISEWVRERDQQQWDEQLDRAATSGRLDFLLEEAEHESGKGLLREWPPAK